MHFGDERAGGVNDTQILTLGIFPDAGCHAVGTENDGGTMGDFREFFDEYGSLVAQRRHHVTVVDDLLADIDGLVIDLQGTFNHFDGTLYPGAKPSRFGQTTPSNAMLFSS